MTTRRTRRDITDLAREIWYANLVACAAVPFPGDITGHEGPVRGGDEDPRYVSLVGTRAEAFQRALAELVNNPGYEVEPWMVTSLRNGIIPGSQDGSLPGSEAVAPEGVQS